MKYLIRYILLSLVATCYLACSTDEIDKWSDKGYVWFPDTMNTFTFRSQPQIAEGESYLVPVPITAATALSDRDRTIEVEVTAQPQDNRTKFEIQKPVVFRANHTVDTMYVKVTNSAHLYSVHDTIAFRLLPSDDFNPGLKKNINGKLCLYNGFSRPSWWDTNAERYIGYFTDLKMEIYIAVTDGEEDPRGEVGSWYNNIGYTYLIYQLGDYITKNNIRYPDDDPYAPGKVPTFNSRSY